MLQALRAAILVEHGSSAAHLRGGQAFEAELGHDLFHVARGDALNVHLRHRKHDGAGRTPPAFERLRVECLVPAPALGYLHRQRARSGVQPFGLVPVRVAAPFGRALVGPRTEVLFAFKTHGKIQQRRERRCHPVRATYDQLFHQINDDPIVPVLHSVLLSKGKNRNGASSRPGPWPRTR